MISRKSPPMMAPRSYPGNPTAGLGRRSKGPLSSSSMLLLLRAGALPLRKAFHRIPLVVWLLVTLQCSWMLVDKVCFSGPIPNFRPYVPPNASSPLSPFYGPAYLVMNAGEIPMKAFPRFEHPFPCGEGMAPEGFRSKEIVQTGFFYIHQKMAAATTLAGITARISRNPAVARRPFPSRNVTTNKDPVPFDGETAVCTTRLVPLRPKQDQAVGAHHRRRGVGNRISGGDEGVLRFLQNRIREESFLWTFVREPVQRVLSKYYHWDVSLQGTVPASLDNLQYFIERNSPGREIYGNYFQFLTPRNYLDPHRIDLHHKFTQEILEAFDFIGVQERFDESLAVLQLLLSLETQDMLYVSSRRPASQGTPRTGASYERFNKKCVALQAPEATLAIKEYLHQPEVFDHLFEADIYFYRAANASLDRTIEALGVGLVEETVHRLEWAQAAVAERCLPKTRFPCSELGEVQEVDDCLFSDVGCGYECLDALGEELKMLPTGAKVS